MKRVLLAGGIGSGKSTVRSLLEQHGAFAVDADRVGHEILAAEAADVVAEMFPEAVVEGHIDRSRLADIVFGDAESLRRLESVTHPHIRARIERQIEGVGRPVVVEVPLMQDFFGPGWVRLVVDASDEVRLERLAARGMSGPDALRRMAAQPPRDVWLEWADLVVPNPGSLEDLERRVAGLWTLLTT